MKCIKCSGDCVEQSYDANVHDRTFRGEYICEDCHKVIKLEGDLAFPEECYINDTLVKPKYTLLKNFCPNCMSAGVTEDGIIPTGKIKRYWGKPSCLKEGPNKKWTYQGHITYHCDICDLDFVLPFKLKNTILT